METMDFGPYFRSAFNTLYFGCLIPFKIVVLEGKQKMYAVERNAVQRVICIVLQGLIFITIFGEIYEAVTNPVQTNLETTLKFFDKTNKFIWGCLFFYAGWFKEKSIISIFGEFSEHRSGQQAIYWTTILTGVTCIFSTFTFYLYYAWAFDSDAGFRKYTEGAWFHYFFQTKTGGDIPVGIQILSVVSLVGRFSRWIMVDLNIWLLDLVAFTTYKLGRNFKQILLQNSGNSHTDEQNVFRYYYKIKDRINRFNELTSPIFLSNFFGMVFFWAPTIADTLESKTFALPFATAAYLSSTTLRMFFAAEAHYQISQIKIWILEPRRQSVLTTAKYLELDTTNLALRGGRFFAITYGFTGTVASVILTYSIMMIQFRGNS